MRLFGEFLFRCRRSAAVIDVVVAQREALLARKEWLGLLPLLQRLDEQNDEECVATDHTSVITKS